LVLAFFLGFALFRNAFAAASGEQVVWLKGLEGRREKRDHQVLSLEFT